MFYQLPVMQYSWKNSPWAKPLLGDKFIEFVENVLGLEEEKINTEGSLLETLIQLYKEAKFKKDYDKVDEIRLL